MEFWLQKFRFDYRNANVLLSPSEHSAKNVGGKIPSNGSVQIALKTLNECQKQLPITVCLAARQDSVHTLRDVKYETLILFNVKPNLTQ